MKWEKASIKDICLGIYDGPHATPPLSDTGGIFLGIPNFVNGRLDLNNVRYISEKDLPKWTKRVTPKENDIVFSYEATLNLYAIIPEGFYGCLGRRMGLLRVDNSKVFYKFLYYYFFSERWQRVIKENTVLGSTVDRLPLIKFPDFPVFLPSLQTQYKIASILSAYDDLIENNQKQIKLLEEAAQRLYKEWFVDLHFPGHESVKIVDGVPEGWSRTRLDEVIEFNPKVSLTKERIKEFVPMSALSNTAMILDTNEITYTQSNSGSKFKNDDTIMARITPCLENGKIAFVQELKSEEGAVGSTEYIVLRSRLLCPSMVYLLSRMQDFRKYAINNMSGSDGRQRVKVERLMEYEYLKPTNDLVCEFSSKVTPMFKNIKHLSKLNAILREARDRLLPKLMSGEIEV